MNNNIIQVNNLTKRFGKFTAVNSINFNIKKGEILGFLGPNGAGKTTTIKMINGLLKITEGRVLIKDYDVKKDLKQVKNIIGYMSQKFSLYPLLTSTENIEFFGGVSGLSSSIIQEKINSSKNIIPENLLNNKVKELPPGIKQKLALYVCLMTDPEIIFLDEPTSGVDPETRRNFWEDIYFLKKQGKTILVTTHNLDEAEYADRIIILHKGDIIIKGEPEKLKQEHGAQSIENLFKNAVIENDKT